MALGLSPNPVCVPLQDCCSDQFLEGCTQLPTGAAWQHWVQTCGKYLSLPAWGFVFWFHFFGSGFEAAAWETCKNTCIIGNRKGVNVREASLGQWERRQKLKDWCPAFRYPVGQLWDIYQKDLQKEPQIEHQWCSQLSNASPYSLLTPFLVNPPPLLLTFQYHLLLAFKLFRNELLIWKLFS